MIRTSIVFFRESFISAFLVTSSSAPESSSSTSTDRPGFSLDTGWCICTNFDMPARRLIVTSPSELDAVEGILLAEFHMPQILSMWPAKKEFGCVGHIFVINCPNGIPVSIQLPKPQRQNHNQLADLYMFCLALWINKRSEHFLNICRANISLLGKDRLTVYIPKLLFSVLRKHFHYWSYIVNCASELRCK